MITGVDHGRGPGGGGGAHQAPDQLRKETQKKVQTSGCAQGTVFGDLMEALEKV